MDGIFSHLWRTRNYRPVQEKSKRAQVFYKPTADGAESSVDLKRAIKGSWKAGKVTS